MGKIITLSTYFQSYQAYIVKDSLEQAGIPCMLVDEFSQQIYGNALGGLRVMIDEDFLESAEKVLANVKLDSPLKCKLVIFDLDGTLLNSLEDLADSANYVLENHGFPTHPLNDYRYFVGDGVVKLIERILPEKERNSEIISLCKKEFVEYYSLHKEDKTSVYEGVTELLENLTNADVKIAVATNKVHSAVAPLMEKYFPNVKFDALFGQREGVNVKPDPKIIFDILETVGCGAEEAIHVGDTKTDVQLAHNAGLKCVGVKWGYRPEKELADAGADFIISSPNELLDIVL